MSVIISPLSLDSLTRDLWGEFDAYAIAQLAALNQAGCYDPKLYRAPSIADEVFAAYAYVAYGIRIRPGSLILGFQLPVDPTTNRPATFNVQITDSNYRMGQEGGHKWFSEPMPSYFLGNYKNTGLDARLTEMGCFPNLEAYPYPVVGDSPFLIEIWETSGAAQRIEFVLQVAEVRE
jgi:hypothetical protein